MASENLNPIPAEHGQHFSATRNFKALAAKNQASAYKSNGDCYVDDTQYSRTDVGINTALAACSPGTTHITAGTYTLRAPIVQGCGQLIKYEGNPTLNFTLSGSQSAIVYNGGQCGIYGNGMTGSAMFNMQNTGGTVFKVCVGGYTGGVFGPPDGVFTVLNQTGNTVDFGPCSIIYSVANFTVQNITSVTVPGDLIQVITNNYGGTQSAAPYIESVTFSHIAAIGLTGRAIRINANTTGPETNVNGLVFTGIFTANMTPGKVAAPIYIQSLFTTPNSISFRVLDSVISFPYATGAVTVVDSDGATNTNASILGIVLDGVDLQGGTLPTVPFSPTLIINAPSTADLAYRGTGNTTFYRAVLAQAFTSITANPAFFGALRLASGDGVCWRNSTDGDDLCFNKNEDDQFSLPGPVMNPVFVKPRIGRGSTLNAVYRVSGISTDSAFKIIAGNSCQEQTLTIPGVLATGVASVSPAGSNLGSLSWSGRVTAANTVAVKVCNPTMQAVALPSVSWNAAVIQ